MKHHHGLYVLLLGFTCVILIQHTVSFGHVLHTVINIQSRYRQAVICVGSLLTCIVF